MSDDINRWKIEKVKLKDVKPYDKNPRQISEKAARGLKASMERFGYVEPIVWNKTTGNIVGGHQRYSQLMKQGVEEASMMVVEMDPEKELAANLTLNNPEIEGEWDEPALALLEQLKGADEELYDALNMGDLESSIQGMKPRQSEESYGDSNREVDIDEMMNDCDTKCPCCNFEWKIDAGDVSVGGE